MTEPSDADIDALAAALRADSADLDIYARVLSTSLIDALPGGMVDIERDRSLADRLAGRDGCVRVVRVTVDDWELSLAVGARGGQPVATAKQKVRGVAISSRQVSLDEWAQLLARCLARSAQQSADGRAALARLLGQA